MFPRYTNIETYPQLRRGRRAQDMALGPGAGGAVERGVLVPPATSEAAILGVVGCDWLWLVVAAFWCSDHVKFCTHGERINKSSRSDSRHSPNIVFPYGAFVRCVVFPPWFMDSCFGAPLNNSSSRANACPEV